MKKNLFLIFIVFILLAPASPILAQEAEEERALEIVYPIFNDLTLTPDTGLPEYVQYLFRAAMALIGLIILFVMIRAGISYIMSTGRAEQLLDAKKSILASLLGAIVLISAFVLFNSINPNLTRLSPIDDLEALEPVVTPGIYLCDYGDEADRLRVNDLIILYKNGAMEEKVEAARELRDVMSNDAGSCYRVKFSANLDKTALSFYNVNLIFSIPERIYDNPDTPFDESDWEYNYGIIFHENSSWRGRCWINNTTTSYFSPSAPSAPLSSSLSYGGFNRTKSVTLFEKPSVKTGLGDVGVGLYQCLDYLTTDKCPPGLTGTGGYAAFPTSGNIRPVPRSLLTPHNLAGSSGTPRTGGGGFGGGAMPSGTTYTEAQKILGTRSVVIDPEGAYFAIMFSGENYDGDVCEVISKSDNNLLDQPIGQCGSTCRGTISDDKKFLRDCVPCLKSMIVVKGNVIY